LPLEFVNVPELFHASLDPFLLVIVVVPLVAVYVPVMDMDPALNAAAFPVIIPAATTSPEAVIVFDKVRVSLRLVVHESIVMLPVKLMVTPPPPVVAFIW
jgi:hypothetical protein